MEYEYENGRLPQRHRGLAIASVVLGTMSCFCCIGTGIGVIPAILAVVFAIISLVGGGNRVRHLAWAGLITGGVGLILNVVVIVYAFRIINWDYMTLENLSTIGDVDPDNKTEMVQWLQRFFRVDLSGLLY